MKYFNSKFFELTNKNYFAINEKLNIIELSSNWADQDLLGRSVTSLFSPEYRDTVLSFFLKEEKKSNENKSELSYFIAPVIDREVGYYLAEIQLSYDVASRNTVGSISALSTKRGEGNILESVLDNLSTMASFFNHEMRLIYANKGFLSWFSLKIDDVIGKKVREIHLSGLNSLIFPYIEEALMGKNQSIELILPSPNENDAYKILNLNFIPKIENKKIEGIYFFLIDITEQKTNTNEALQREKKMQVLFNGLSQGVVVHDFKGRIIEFNPSALKILGVTGDQLLGKSSYDEKWRLINEDHTPMLPQEQPAMIALRTGIPVTNKIIGVYTVDESLVWISVTAIPLFEKEESKPYRILVTFEDMTKFFRLKQELKAKSAWKEAILDGADYSLISTTSDGMIVTFNKKAEELLGYKADEVINKTTPMILHDPKDVIERAKLLSAELGEEIKPGFEVFVLKALRFGKDTQPWDYITKSGERIAINLQVTAIRDDKNNCIGFLGMSTRAQ